MVNELIKVKYESDKALVSARELHEFLEVKSRFNDWIKNRIKKYGFEEEIDYTKIILNKKRGQLLFDYIVNIDIAKDICRRERSNKNAAKVLSYLVLLDNKEVLIVEPQRKELVFVEKLKEILKSFNLDGTSQYKVLNYRIDYYIPKLNIAIEYDEDNHKNYTYERQEGRQKEIEKKLGCKFIRVSDKDSDEYNIGYIIKEMFNINLNVA